MLRSPTEVEKESNVYIKGQYKVIAMTNQALFAGLIFFFFGLKKEVLCVFKKCF